MFYGITKNGKLRKTKHGSAMTIVLYSAESIPKEDFPEVLATMAVYDAYIEKRRMTWSKGLIMKGSGVMKKSGAVYGVGVAVTHIDMYYTGPDVSISEEVTDGELLMRGLNGGIKVGELIMTDPASGFGVYTAPVAEREPAATVGAVVPELARVAPVKPREPGHPPKRNIVKRAIPVLRTKTPETRRAIPDKCKNGRTGVPSLDRKRGLI